MSVQLPGGRKARILLSVLTGVLLSLGWTQWMTGLVLVVALIPLLTVEDFFFRNRTSYSSYSFLFHSVLAVLVWNLISTWWIMNASLFGMIAAVLVSSLFMSLSFWLFHVARRTLGAGPGYFMLVFFWLGFEYLYLNGEVSWPWLTLGNGLAKDVWWIQWFEFTGALGGSLWIMVINILLFIGLQHWLKTGLRSAWPQLVSGVLIFLCPMGLSFVLYRAYQEEIRPVEVVVIQPNIDPYLEKFDGMSPDEQVNILLSLAADGATAETEFFVGPETALPQNIWEHQLDQAYNFRQVAGFLKDHPTASFVVGASTGKVFEPGEPLTPTARKFRNGDLWYDHYNTALNILPDSSFEKYHKSQLVIGVEKMPFRKTWSFMEDLALNLGGTMGSLATQENRGVFTDQSGTTVVAPVICYESVYGAYLSEYIRNSAQLIFVITNDGWWGETPGYRQHFQFARLRAIETRRSVARSANTGISGFINQRGDILQQTAWGERTAIRQSLNANDRLTVYVQWGDYLGRIALLPAILGLLMVFVRRLSSGGKGLLSR